MTAVPTMKAKMEQPTAGSREVYQHIRYNARFAKRMVHQGSGRGRTVTICGAGPSLAEECERLPKTNEVWAANSALNYLWTHDVRPTHAVTVDQNHQMTDPSEWGIVRPVTYLVATCAHPRLTDLLMRRGARVRWFHSYQGVPDPPGWTPPPLRPGDPPHMKSYEWALYCSLYGDTCQVGYGLNTVPRAMCLAAYLGYEKIYVVGADCACQPDSPPMPIGLDSPEYMAWLRDLRFYADGRTASIYGPQEWMMEAEIDGVRWHSRADMVLSARMMVEMAAQDSRFELVGRTLPNAIWPHRHDKDWMDDLPRFGGDGEVSHIGIHGVTPKREDATMQFTPQPEAGVGMKLVMGGRGTVTPPEEKSQPAGPVPKEDTAPPPVEPDKE